MSKQELIKKENSTQKSLNRIASLDFQRGLAVWMMVFLHVFNHIYDYSWVDMDTMFNGSIPYFLAGSLVLLAFFGSWAGYFVLLSGIVTTLTFFKSTIKGKSVKNLLKKQFLTGFGILIVGYLTEAFGYYGYFGSSIRAEKLLNIMPFLWRRLFIMEALQIIGYTYILNAIILYFLSINNGVSKYRRNITIYAILFMIVLGFTPLIWNWIDNLSWIPYEPSGYHATWPSEYLQYTNASFVTYLCVIIAGDLYPIFPFISTTFAGAIIGIMLSAPKPFKKTPRYIFYGNSMIFLITIGIMIFGNFNITFERPPMGYYLLLLWTQISVVNVLLWLVEFRGNGAKFGNHLFTRYFRRWGMIPMTIFALQIWSLAPRIIFNFTVPSTNLLNERLPYGKEWIVLMFAVITVIFYDILIWLWGKVNFKGSFEWMVLRLNHLEKDPNTSRLNFKNMIYHVNWVNY
ncbi:hypothetical protein [Candidatus Harpocratesius sp.]